MSEEIDARIGKMLCDFDGDVRVTRKEIVDLLTAAEERIAELEEVVKAVAHIGVDFGYGKYELEPETIDKARALYESK